VVALAGIIRSAYLKSLWELTLYYCHLTGHFHVVADAMISSSRTGPSFPSLVHLNVCHDPPLSEALGRLLSSGACPRIERLPIGLDRIVDDHLIAIMDALKNGHCPDLKEFTWNLSNDSIEIGEAVGSCLVSSKP